MLILGLDISTAATGVAIGDGTAPPRSYVFKVPPGSRGERGASYAFWFRNLLVVEAPDLVAFEAPLMTTRAKGKGGGIVSNIESTRMLMGLAFLTETVAAGRKVHAIEANIQAWRKLFLGHGRPADPKGDCVRMCRLLGWDVGDSHDRADACGVWAYAHYQHGNRQAIMRALSDSSVRRMTA